MPDPVDLAYALKLEPREVIDYFASKGYDVESWNWFDSWQRANARAFTVAKAGRLDVLTEIKASMQAVFEEGITEREFLKRLSPKLKALGWWGKQIVVDPAGGAEVAQLGSPHRLRTIYQTNARTAYQTGRFRQFQANAESRPFWQYVAVMDESTRPSHAALHGKVFRHDDPIWEAIYPPNGFNCRCRVRTHSRRSLERNGLQVESSRGKVTFEEVDVGVDKRTGEVIQERQLVWRGKNRNGEDAVFRPDPGWSYNPGAGP